MTTIELFCLRVLVGGAWASLDAYDGGMSTSRPLHKFLCALPSQVFGDGALPWDPWMSAPLTPEEQAALDDRSGEMEEW